MKHVITYFLIAIALVGAALSYNTSKNSIIKETISKEGISVIYTNNKDTFALDYLTANEYDSLKQVLNISQRSVYYYNAYAPGYDEYFIVKSYLLLPIDTIVHFDDHAVATHEKTGYTAKILSIYTDTIK